MSRGPALLSIHAVDNLGDEGVVTDAAACAELECRHAAVVTGLLTHAADGMVAFDPVGPDAVGRQFDASVATCRPRVARTGILSGEPQVERVADLLRESDVADVIVAPVVKIGGARLLDDETLEATRRHLFPLARLVVVRAGDLKRLADTTPGDIESARRGAAALRSAGARAVLVAGTGSRGRVVDVLDDAGHVGVFSVPRLAAPRISGLAGAHAAALAAWLARGSSLPDAVAAAQRYVSLRLERGR